MENLFTLSKSSNRFSEVLKMVLISILIIASATFITVWFQKVIQSLSMIGGFADPNSYFVFIGLSDR